MGLLDEQTVFITGASKGIGQAIALLFAKEGAEVALASRSIEDLQDLANFINADGGYAHPILLDLKSEDSIKEAVKSAQIKMGKIDILINNAGIIALHKIHETPTDALDDLFNINVRGVYITCREVLPCMMERKSGRIINIGSMAGRRGYAEQAAYCASKHALVGFSKVLAIETQEYNIRVNMLSPGGVLTGLSKELRASRNEPEDAPEWMTAEEVAKAALYLCTQTGAAFTDELVLRRFVSEPWR